MASNTAATTIRAEFSASGEASLSASLTSTNVLPQMKAIITSSKCALSERERLIRWRLPLLLCGLRLACAGEIQKRIRSEEHTSELQSRGHLVCRLLLEK